MNASAPSERRRGGYGLRDSSASSAVVIIARPCAALTVVGYLGSRRLFDRHAEL
jgi:hypothetical protein